MVVTWQGSDDPTTDCPSCDTPLVIVAVTGVTAEEAIARAAQQLDAERAGDAARPMYQPSIPGIHPPFDFESAMRSILDQRAVVRRAEAIAESKHKDAAFAKKHAESEQATLSELEDKLADRVREIEYEASLTDEERAERTAKGCAWELATGRPCLICRNPKANHSASNASDGHLAAAVRVVARTDDGIDDKSLQIALQRIAQMAVPLDTIEGWNATERDAVAAWIEQPVDAPRPEVLGRAHVVGPQGGLCVACGALLQPLAEAAGLIAWPVGQQVGTDCEGEPAVVEPEPARTPKPRHATKAARQQAKQAVSREKAPVAKKTPKKSRRKN